jgi:fructan beta-fructosidase
MTYFRKHSNKLAGCFKLPPYTILLAAIILLFAACGGNEKAPATVEEMPEATNLYSEPHRPQFHHSPPIGWTNDPNGMVYFDGEYHLFYQHYPDSTVWGPMHWGHAVSKDLVHWENLPIALYPDSLGYIFSGSAVVDTKNTAGFGQNGQPPLVAMFTLHDMKREKDGTNSHESQGIAYSNDRGRTWKMYEGNPVMPNPGGVRDIRDPKLIWHEATKQWVVTLAVGDHIEFWAAPDLKKWTKLSEFGKTYGGHGGVWECPDLFPMKVEGTEETKWVLIVNINPGGPNGGSVGQYFVGNFDGKTFTLDPGFAKQVPLGKGAWMDWGKDNYAAVTWSDAPDGRRLLLGWMSNWEYANQVPTGVWRNAMTLVRSMSLSKNAKGYYLKAEPVQEQQALRSKTMELQKTELTAPVDITGSLGFVPTLSEMELEFEMADANAGSFGVELSNTKGETYRIGYDAKAKQFFSDRSKSGDASFSEKFAAKASTAPRFAEGNKLTMHLFFDVASAELFADGGSTVMTEIFFPTEVFTQAKLFSEGGKVTLVGGKAHQLKSIWK